MQTFNADIAIIGAGGAGLRAAIAAAEANPQLKIALISKVYPMRSHTVAAEGGSAAVTQAHDSYDFHFNDTVSGGDWLCEQDVVDYFVEHCPTEMTQLELWGCPWSRKEDACYADTQHSAASDRIADRLADARSSHCGYRVRSGSGRAPFYQQGDRLPQSQPACQPGRYSPGPRAERRGPV